MKINAGDSVKQHLHFSKKSNLKLRNVSKTGKEWNRSSSIQWFQSHRQSQQPFKWKTCQRQKSLKKPIWSENDKCYVNISLPDCHNAVTVFQQRTALTLFRPCVPKGHVPNKDSITLSKQDSKPSINMWLKQLIISTKVLWTIHTSQNMLCIWAIVNYSQPPSKFGK